MTKTELIKAERLTYGDGRYRLKVRHRWLFFSWQKTYAGKPSDVPRLCDWYHQGHLITSKWIMDDLDELLSRALVAGQVPPVGV